MLIIMDQVSLEAQDPNFHPPYLVGCPEILDPYNDVQLPSYGITDQESTDRIRGVYSLWSRRSGVSGGRGLIETPGG
jgi:hypothetical protein